MENNNPHWTQGNISTNGLTLHYYRTGGDKPPMLLAHGISDNGLCWTRAARALESDYDLIMVDLRGHGRSDKPASGYHLTDYTVDLAGVIEGLGLGATAVMGHSLGGGIAGILAADHAHLVSRLFLEDPVWFDTENMDIQENLEGMQAFGAMLEQMKSQPLEAIAAEGKQMNPTWSDEEFPAWAESKKQVFPKVFNLGPEDYTNWQETARKIKAPTLLITATGKPGEPDSVIVTPHVAETAAALNPNISTVQIANAGHNIRREQFEAFITAVRGFN